MAGQPTEVPSRLPTQLSSFIGREDEIARARDLLRGSRLLTLTGPGGSGKTRMALAIAGEEQHAYQDGACFVSLAAVSDPDFVVPAIATALGIRPTTGQSALDGLGDYIGERPLLLVLDNFEQVVSAAPLVTNLLGRSPGLTVIVTSRVVLHVGGEQNLPVLPLAVLATDRAATVAELDASPAVKLFVERARSVDPDFQVTHSNAAAVAEICRRVDGLPLAIELAAARLGMFSPQALADRLERRLPLLAGGPRDAPVRQQTIRNTIAWSYDLLAPDEQQLFGLASVFVGGWTFEAIERVASESSIDVLKSLAALVDHSLVFQERQPDGSTRFRMLEIIREYGQNRLIETEQLSDARTIHATYMLEFVERANRASITNKQLIWARLLLADLDNIRAALRWSIEHDPLHTLRIASSLSIFWLTNGFLREGGDWIESALARAPDAPVSIRAHALSNAGELACWQGDFGSARDMLEASRDLFAEINAEEDYNYSLFTLARLAQFQGDVETADALYEQCTVYHRSIGKWYAVAGASGNRGMMAMERDDIERAAQLIEEALLLCREHEFVVQIAIWARSLGNLAIRRHDLAQARQLLTEALQIDADISRGRISEDLEGFAALATVERQPERAVRLYGAAKRQRLTTGFPIYDYQRASYDRDIAIVRAALSAPEFDDGWRQGLTMTADEAIEFALDAPATSGAIEAARTTPHETHLTPREIEVLRLLAEGATDREIAAALFISPYTVMRHVANIFNKLGLSSRTAAATWAVRNGLV